MSLKHMKFSVGTPNEVSYATGRPVRIRDELGLLLEPGEFANPACRDCSGRGFITLCRTVYDPKPLSSGDEVFVQEGLEAIEQRGYSACRCAVRRRAWARGQVARGLRPVPPSVVSSS